MKVETREGNAAKAAREWARVYGSRRALELDASKIGAELKELGRNPNPDDVDRIVGNRSWTYSVCEECHNEREQVVVMGDNTRFCGRCLTKALSLLDAASG